MPIPALLDELLRAHGPSGHEHLAFDVVRAAVDGIAEVETDAVGNLTATRRGRGDGPLLALFAHLDVVGSQSRTSRTTGSCRCTPSAGGGPPSATASGSRSGRGRGSCPA